MLNDMAKRKRPDGPKLADPITIRLSIVVMDFVAEIAEMSERTQVSILQSMTSDWVKRAKRHPELIGRVIGIPGDPSLDERFGVKSEIKKSANGPPR